MPSVGVIFVMLLLYDGGAARFASKVSIWI